MEHFVELLNAECVSHCFCLYLLGDVHDIIYINVHFFRYIFSLI